MYEFRKRVLCARIEGMSRVMRVLREEREKFVTKDGKRDRHISLSFFSSSDIGISFIRIHKK
jgi:hypothetical protein